MENNNPQKSQEMGKLIFSQLADFLVSQLPGRSGEIIRKRFGMAQDRSETLEKIGLEYGITRERVRQIIAGAMKDIAKFSADDNFRRAEDILIFTIEKNNGIIKEEDIMLDLGATDFKDRNGARFIAECSGKIFIREEKGIISKSWAADGDIFEAVRKIAQEAERIFLNEKRTLSKNEIVKKLGLKFPEMSEWQIESAFSTLTRVKKNIFDKWGMRDWEEISPKGTREKIHLVLKEENKPLHFSEIAALIDKYKLGKRKAHPQTVHNELIKDGRFVLIGRGIYALREWGYFEGTIREVLTDILKKEARPLTKKEILEKVMKMRQVKKTTVMINLNNTPEFVRQDDVYSLKK